MQPMLDAMAVSTDNLRRTAFAAMAELLRPAHLRPRARELAEHEIRVARSGAARQHKSVWGDAFRAYVNADGLPWRLHYWRSKGVVYFADLVAHDVVRIPEGPLVA